MYLMEKVCGVLEMVCGFARNVVTFCVDNTS